MCDCYSYQETNETQKAYEQRMKAYEAKHIAGQNTRIIPPGFNGQPSPKPNSNKPTWHLVIEDMLARDNVGRKKYNTPLQPHNGRDSLQDAYEEALDLCVYLKNAIEERK